MRSAACGADEVSSVGRRSSAEWLNETRRHTTHLRFDVSRVSGGSSSFYFHFGAGYEKGVPCCGSAYGF